MDLYDESAGIGKRGIRRRRDKTMKIIVFLCLFSTVFYRQKGNWMAGKADERNQRASWRKQKKK